MRKDPRPTCSPEGLADGPGLRREGQAVAGRRLERPSPGGAVELSSRHRVVVTAETSGQSNRRHRSRQATAYPTRTPADVAPLAWLALGPRLPEPRSDRAAGRRDHRSGRSWL